LGFGPFDFNADLRQKTQIDAREFGAAPIRLGAMVKAQCGNGRNKAPREGPLMRHPCGRHHISWLALDSWLASTRSKLNAEIEPLPWVQGVLACARSGELEIRETRLRLALCAARPCSLFDWTVP
jgi:hypothetical protein